MTSLAEEAREFFLAAYADEQERPIKELFELFAEYERSDGYEDWCKQHRVDPVDDASLHRWETVHEAYLIAWRMLGWDEFRERLRHASLIVASRGYHLHE